MENTAETSGLDMALKLAENGVFVFPCRATGRPKSPLVKWKTQATCDIETVRAWWRRWPEALVGVPTGDTNSITVLDIDKKNDVDGYSSLIDLDVDLEQLQCPTVRTPTGGLHLYFDYVEGLKNSAGKIGPGLDVRNDGGFVIAAGEIKGLGRYEASFLC